MPLVHSSLYRRPMNRMVVFLVAMWFISGTAFAQEEKKNTETTVSDKISWDVSSHVDGQKFEILARPHDSRLTYRINKEDHMGQVPLTHKHNLERESRQTSV